MLPFLSGIKYNFRGLAMGLKTPSLLLLGLLRLLVIFFAQHCGDRPGFV